MGDIRGEVTEPFMGYPDITAFQKLVPNSSVNDFLAQFRTIADAEFSGVNKSTEVDNAPHIEAPEFDPITIVQAEETYRSRDYYRLRNARGLSVPVLDVGETESWARIMRALWQINDLGDTVQTARDEIERTAAEERPWLHIDTFTRINRGRAEGRQAPRRQLGFILNTGECSDAAEGLITANRVLVDVVGRRLKGKRGSFAPTAPFVPVVPFAVFSQRATSQQVESIEQKARQVLREEPIKVPLKEDLVIRMELKRKLKGGHRR